ncbi:50S ribosomal protein L18e [Candidatus Micrarchaeota archaeon]|nr:50S ribosomal protein L18e [Candidatus Micrarchaeota archaeon]
MKKDNQVLVRLISSLMKESKPLWKKVAYELSRPRRQRVTVNLSKIEDYAKDEAVVLVPGKVLGSGAISKKVKIAAFSFSDSARKLIAGAGGHAMTIDELYKNNPQGKDIMILK